VKVCQKMVASAILADVEPVRPARRTVFSGRQDAGLHGRQDARRHMVRQPLSNSAPHPTLSPVEVEKVI
jgi:hypothetical protein